jgi:aryl-alcohol dehydrogenase-like predicted oxidoreductase
MQYTTLGSSGLKISRIALGCMSFGDTARGPTTPSTTATAQASSVTLPD